jgi:hypothetical protein
MPAYTIVDKLLPLIPHTDRRLNTWGPRRWGQTPKAIVWHVAEGDAASTVNWFNNPASQASAQYEVLRSGLVYQYVLETESAYANGVVHAPRLGNPVVAALVNSGLNLNDLTIAIETERFWQEPLTTPQARTLAALTRDIMDRWHIPLDEDHILGHNEIDSVTRGHCPGNLDWAALLADVFDGNPVDPGKPAPTPSPASRALLAAAQRALALAGTGTIPDLVGLASCEATITHESARAPGLPVGAQCLVCEKTVLWTLDGARVDSFHRGQYEALLAEHCVQEWR